ncbi:Ionotropic receptor 688 [Blattella germanica]|nr:Ionotropic receptor 688 [Blattella germanica]
MKILNYISCILQEYTKTMELHFSILLLMIAQCSAAILLPEEETHVITYLKIISQLHLTTLSKFIIFLPDVEETSPNEERYFINQNPSSTSTDMAQSLLTEINGMNKLIFLIQPDILNLKDLTPWLEIPGPIYTNDVVIVFFTNNNLGTAITKFMHSKPELILIFIVTSEFSYFEEDMVQKCLEVFAKAKLFNVLFLLPNLHISKSKRTQVKSLLLYSLYPNYPIKNCGVMDNRMDVNIWSLEDEGKFVDTKPLFPEVVASGFKGCEISATRNIIEGSYLGLNSLVEDIGIMYLKIAAKAMGMKLKVYDGNEEFSADVYMNVLSLNSLNHFKFEFPTHIFLEIKLKWHVPCPQSISRHGNFIRVFSYQIWLQFFLAAILFALVIHRLHKSSDDSKLSRLYFSYTLLRIWSILTGVSAEVDSSVYKIRIVFFIWVLFCLIVSTVFQAFFTGFLIEPGMYVPISNVKELNSTGITRALPVKEYISLIYSITESDAMDIADSECSFQMCWIRYGTRKNFSFLADTLLMGPLGRGLGFQICTIEDNAITVFTTFYIRRESYFFKLINLWIIRIAESGISAMLERYVVEGLERKLGPKVTLDQASSDDYFIFGMRHLKLVFFSLGIGYLISSVVFAFEKFHHKLGLRRFNKIF